MKNITLSAKEEAIEAARRAAAQRGTTLNAEFRAWLETQRLSSEDRVKRLNALWSKPSHLRVGKKLTREEMNER